jgi:flagellar biosynthesis/type III secretory pathway chaperone
VVQLNSQLDKFLDLLEQVTVCHQSLLTVINEEKNALIDANLMKLNEAAKVKGDLLSKLQILDDQRIQRLGQLADHLAHPPQGLTLRILCQLIAEPHATRLKVCRSRLFTLVKNIQKANERNRALLNCALELIRGSVNLINNLLTSSPVYFRTGNLQNRNQSGKLLRGEI